MTRLLVLGMLDAQPLSGYDIQQLLRLSDAERWGGVLIGSIYHALKKLESEGHIEISRIETTGHRQKAVYNITAKGREYMKTLTLESLQAASLEYPTTLYSGLSFSHKVQEADAVKSLEKQREYLKKEQDSLAFGLKAKSDAMQNYLPPMTQLIFDHMFGLIKLQQDFVEKAITLLDK
jgi:DNA-binding PadR family transcriptional regulator